MSTDRITAYRAAEAALWASVGLAPTEYQIRLAATGTAIRVQEVGQGDPVVFVHGDPNAGSTWAPMVEHLDGLRCLILDRPGTGLSAAYPITASNLPRVGAAFVPDVLDALSLDRAHVVASSFGGHLALRSAAARPERFRRMVQLSCPALAPGEQVPPFIRLLTRASVRRIVAALPPTERASRWIMRQIGHGASVDAGRIPQDFFDWYVALQRHTDTMRHDGELIAQVVPRRSLVTLSDELLEAVAVPTLFWWGADDPFGGEGVAGHLVGTMPQAELTMVPDAGHLPWLDDPPGAAAATMSFLREKVAP